jgi:transposase
MMINSTDVMPRRPQEPEMLSLLDRHKIQVLLEAGHTKADVAKRTGASPATIARVAGEQAVSHVDDRRAAKERGVGRPSQTTPLVDDVRAWLAVEPTVQTQELLRRAQKDKGYTGKKSAFYAIVAALRPKVAPPVVLFDGVPGEFSQHDFGEVDVRFSDGSVERIHFFASRLKYSRFAQVSIVDNQRVETLIRGLCKHFQAFGGVPLLAVFDRPRTVVLETGSGRDVRRFNATFAQAILEMGCGVEMCAARSGNQKGTVEAIVKWVKNSFFKGRVFRDRADLEAQLAAWLVETNTERPNRATNVIPEVRRREELARLRPLGVLPENLAVRVPATVGPSGHVVFEGARYMVAPEATNCPATLFVYEDRIRIEAGRRVSEQRRRSKSEPIEAAPEHRAARVAAVFGNRGKLYEQRQQLLELGPVALEFFTELVHRRRKDWPVVVESLHQMLLDHGEDAMRDALGVATALQTFTVAAVERRLIELLRAPQQPRPEGAVRGAHARGQLVMFPRGGVRVRRPGGDR